VTRVNLVLLAVLVACALSLVTSRHQARKLTGELAREQVRARAFETEYGQLSLEQSTWAMPARVEKIARERLRLQHAGPGRVEIVELPALASAAGPSQGASRAPSGGSAAADAASVGVVTTAGPSQGASRAPPGGSAATNVASVGVVTSPGPSQGASRAGLLDWSRPATPGASADAAIRLGVDPLAPRGAPRRWANAAPSGDGATTNVAGAGGADR